MQRQQVQVVIAEHGHRGIAQITNETQCFQ
jgi:hypothetical protein